MKKNTFNITFCSIISALSVVFMMITAFFPFATYTAPALACILSAVTVIEVNKKWTLAVHLVVSVISLLIVPDKESVILYILFFGYYPAIKQVIESHINNRILQMSIKIAVFSVSAVISYFMSIYVLGISSDEYKIFSVNLPLIFLIMGIVVFVMFDYGLSGLITMYFTKVRDKLLNSINRDL